MEELNGINIQKIIDQVWSMVLEYGPKLLLAIVTLIIGLWLIKKISRLAEKGMHLSKADDTLGHFIKNLIGWILKILLLLSIASMIGIETTAFIAIFSAATLAVGFALQGSLSNLAGGVILLIFKPYKTGDLIESQDHLGVVKKIQMFNTVLVNIQGKTIIIPNGAVANNSIVNLTAEGKLRVDLIAGISYDADIKQAKEILISILENDPLVLKIQLHSLELTNWQTAL